MSCRDCCGCVMAFSVVIDLCKCFLFSCFVIVYFFLFFVCIIHSAFNMFVFPNYMFTSLSSLFFLVFLKIFFRYFL